MHDSHASPETAQAALQQAHLRREALRQAWDEARNPDLLCLAVLALPRLLRADRCGIFIASTDRTRVWLEAGTGVVERQIEVSAEGTKVGAAMQAGAPLFSDASQEASTTAPSTYPVQTALTVPVNRVDGTGVVAVVQVLTHYSTEVLGRTMQRLDVSVQETLNFTSPIYHMELLMTARHFAQSADLYASIEMSNPNYDEVMSTFREAAGEVHDAVAAGDREAFHQLFDEVGTFFGPFSSTALEQSSFLIDRLVERM